MDNARAQSPDWSVVPGAVLIVLFACGCTTDWMWLTVRNDTDRPVHVALTGRESAVALDLAPHNSVELSGYQLKGEIVHSGVVTRVSGQRSRDTSLVVVSDGDGSRVDVIHATPAPVGGGAAEH